MSYIDLHVHSTASDGTFTPRALVEYAIEKNLKAIAITDHDTVNGIPGAMNAAKETGLLVIPGIELSANYSGVEIHILGYNIDYHNQELFEALEPIKNAKKVRNEQMISNLNNIGIDISNTELHRQFPNSTLTRAHIAKYLIEQGYVKDRKEAFNKYIGKNSPCYVKRKNISSAYAINLIEKVGGIPVLAHPLLYHLNFSELYSMIEELKSFGLRGIEAIYSSHSNSDELELRKMADNIGLFITGGSDFHGEIKPDIDLGIGKGNLRIPFSILENTIL